MLPEHKALIGRECFVKVEGEQKLGKIVGLVESITIPETVILYCVQLIPRPEPIVAHYDIGTDSVDLKVKE